MNFEEILKSAELTELISKKSGIPKDEWDIMIKDKKFGQGLDTLFDLLGDSTPCFEGTFDPTPYGFTYKIVELFGLYFAEDYDGSSYYWEGPFKSLESLYETPFFSCCQSKDDNYFEIKTSLDYKEVFKILGECNAPISLNGVKFDHDGKQYVKTN